MMMMRLALLLPLAYAADNDHINDLEKDSHMVPLTKFETVQIGIEDGSARNLCCL